MHDSSCGCLLTNMQLSYFRNLVGLLVGILFRLWSKTFTVCSGVSIEPIVRDVKPTARVDKTACSLSDFIAFPASKAVCFSLWCTTPMLARIASLPRKQQRFPSILSYI